MRIRKLITCKEDLFDYVWGFLKYKTSEEVWREEDLPKLKAFFNYKEGGNWTAEVKESFNYYKDCLEEYANAEFEKSHAVAGIDKETICEVFMIECIENAFEDEEGNEVDEDGNILPEFNRENLKVTSDFDRYELPFILVGHIDTGFDRCGNMAMLVVEVVEKKEFDLTLG